MAKEPEGPRKLREKSISLRTLMRLHVTAAKPLEVDFPSGKLVMSVEEMRAALREEEDTGSGR
jgi:hypothetical protein